MSPLDSFPLRPVNGFPRVSGDEPLAVNWTPARYVFSPRERG